MSSTPQKEVAFSDRKPAVYVMAVLSGFTAEAFCCPFDVTKTRLQIQGEIANKYDYKLVMAPKRGFINTLIGIAKEEGITKLYQGYSALLCRHMVYSGMRITIYRTLKEDYYGVPRGQSFSVGKTIVCGLLSGASAQIFATPTDVCRVRMQMEGKRRALGMEPRIKNLRHAFKDAYSQGGFRGLWKGALPGVIRGSLVTTGDIAGYDKVKQMLMTVEGVKDDVRLHVVTSLASGLLATIVGAPADVVYTRTMHQRVDKTGKSLTYRHGIDTVIKSVKNEGILSLYKGFVPLYVKCGPWALVFWVTFETLAKLGGQGW